MRYPAQAVVCATVVAAGLAVSRAVRVQPATGAPPSQTGTTDVVRPEVRRHHEMQKVMQDMAQEMARMQEQMGKDDLTPEMRKQMSASLKRMSDMMRRMSGLVDRPSMKDAEAKKQLDELRKQMDAMAREPMMKEPRK